MIALVSVVAHVLAVEMVLPPVYISGMFVSHCNGLELFLRQIER